MLYVKPEKRVELNRLVEQILK